MIIPAGKPRKQIAQSFLYAEALENGFASKLGYLDTRPPNDSSQEAATQTPRNPRLDQMMGDSRDSGIRGAMGHDMPGIPGDQNQSPTEEAPQQDGDMSNERQPSNPIQVLRDLREAVYEGQDLGVEIKDQSSGPQFNAIVYDSVGDQDGIVERGTINQIAETMLDRLSQFVSKYPGLVVASDSRQDKQGYLPGWQFIIRSKTPAERKKETQSGPAIKKP